MNVATLVRVTFGRFLYEFPLNGEQFFSDSRRNPFFLRRQLMATTSESKSEGAQGLAFALGGLNQFLQMEVPIAIRKTPLPTAA